MMGLRKELLVAEESRSPKSIFLAALEKQTPEDRSTYIDKACGDDEHLRGEVERLLKMQSGSENSWQSATIDSEGTVDFTTVPDLRPNKSPVSEELLETIPKSPHREGPGSVVGHYQLLEPLGEGGMGVVYLADQKEPVRRKVALKIIKPGMDSERVIARFEAERQALAMMEHNNISRVLDAGTTEMGRPYFVMELVRGVTISDYCDKNKLSIPKRLELFIDVCNAIQHAHQKGIIHRDIKPSNVLITTSDGSPVPKVIDFGVAKAIEEPLTDNALQTRQGQILGTLEYMSPEQSDLTGIDIDTRSDIYSLGVLLYELLTGSTPYTIEQLKKSGFTEMLRMIREDEPAKPSTRLNANAVTLATVSYERGTEPRRLSSLLRGDLDWIVMKTLEKDRSRRYETASALAADIRRFLSNDAVEARPPSTVYRLRKLIRKHRAAVTTGAVVAALLVFAAVFSTWQAIEARTSEQKAVKAEGEAVEAKSLAEQSAEDERLAQAVAADKQAEAERQLRIATAMRLALQAKTIRDTSPVKGLLLAIEAVESTRREGEPIVSTAHQALRQNLESVNGRPLKGHTDDILAMSTSPNGRWLATGSMDKTVLLWDLESDDPYSKPSVLVGHEEGISSLAFTPDNRWLVSGSYDSTARIWDTTGDNQSEPVAVLQGHKKGIDALAISLDGRWLATASQDKTARLWDLKSSDHGAAATVLSGHKGKVISVAFSHDSKRVATGSNDGTSRVWKIATNDSPAKSVALEGHAGWVEKVGFTEDSQKLVTACTGGKKRIRIWNIDEDQPKQQADLPGDFTQSRSMATSPDGKHIATVGTDGRLQLWSLDEQEMPGAVATLSGEEFQFESLSIGKEGRWLTAISQDQSVQVFDLAADDPIASARTFRGHGQPMQLAVVAATGSWLATCAADGGRLCDMTETNVVIAADLSHSTGEPNESVQLSPDGRWLVTRAMRKSAGDETDEVLIRDLSSNQSNGISLQRTARTAAVAFSPDSRLIAVGDATGETRVHALARDFPVSVKIPSSRPDSEVTSLTMSADGRWLVTGMRNPRGSISDEFRLWDLNAKAPEGSSNLLKLYSKESAPKDSVVMFSSGSIEFSPDGRWLAASGEVTDNGGETSAKPSVWVWDLQDKQSKYEAIELSGLTPEERINLHFSPDGRWLVANQAPSAILWDLRSETIDPAGVVLEQGSLFTGVQAVTFSPDGRWLATGGNGWSDEKVVEARVRLWDLSEAKLSSPRRVFRGHEDEIASLAFSPNVRWLVSGSWDLTARLWDVASDDPASNVSILRGHEGAIQKAVVSDDSRWLVTASDNDAVLYLWDLQADYPASSAIALAGHEVGVPWTAFTHESGGVVSLDHGGNLRIWNLDLESLISQARQRAGRELTSHERREYSLK